MRVGSRPAGATLWVSALIGWSVLAVPGRTVLLALVARSLVVTPLWILAAPRLILALIGSAGVAWLLGHASHSCPRCEILVLR